MYVSVRGRVLINVEALNMTESVGNYVKHRRVPVILPTGGYTAFFVPAISGESIAHGYQEVLANIALSKKLPVCSLCSKGIFLKSTNEEVIKRAFNIQKVPGSEHEVETLIVKNCVVEDVGGFLYAPRGGGQAKRTSNFFTGYMIPVREALESTVIEPQLHMRYALGTPFVKSKREAGQLGQMIYYVELSSSVFAFSFDLDTKFIGKATFSIDHIGEDLVSDSKERVKVALLALEKFLTELLFGANKTRFLPIVEWESLVIAVSDDVWTVLSPNSAKYVGESINKLKSVNPNVKLFVYINPDVLKGTSEYIKKKTEEIIESMKLVIEEWKKNIKEKLPDHADKVDWDKIVKEKLEKLISSRLSDVAESSDLRYISNIQEAYVKAIEQAKESENVKLYEDFATCISEAIREGMNRL